MQTPSLRQLLKRLWNHINPERRVQFALLFLIMVITAFTEVISIGAVLPFLGVLTAPDQIYSHPVAQPIINILSLTSPEQLIFPLTLAFVLGALLAGVMRLVLLWVQTRLGHAIGADFSIRIYTRTLYQLYSVHVSRNSSEVIAGVSLKANHVVNSIIMPFLTIFSNIIITFFILLALLAIEPIIAIVSFVGFGAIYFFVTIVTKKRLDRDSLVVNHESNLVFKALQEGLGGIRDVLIDGTQQTFSNIYRNSDLPLRRALANIAIIGGCPRYAIEALGTVLIASLAYSLANSSTGITGTIPVLGALALGAQRLLPVLQQIYSSWVGMRGGKASLLETLKLLEQPLPSGTYSKPVPPIPFFKSITLNNLAFRYSEKSPFVLQPSINLTISKGSRIGLIGATGSGKSTLLDLIMGLLQPTLGTLKIDGVSISDENRRAWQSHIAHVPQSIFLADTSIAENIAFGIPPQKINHKQVKIAAKKAQIAQTIESWEKKYDTIVGEKGVRLSGGQRQRIGVARALYKNADVLVFDEATSALDNNTETALMKALEGLASELTLIIVAHRISTLRNCTQVVELENGRIKQIGSYEKVVGQQSSLNHKM